MSETPNAGFSQTSGGPGIEVLAWKCPHTTVYSAVHYYEADVPEDVVDEAKTNLLAFYQSTATCDCIPVTVQP